MPRRGQVLLAAGALTAITVGVYANSFSGAFLFDDLPGIVGKEPLWRDAPLWAVAAGHGQTPLVALTLALNYRLGGLDVWGYHLVNLTVHVLAGLALLGIVRRTLRTGRLRQRFGDAADALAAVAAGLWLVHPLQTESVTYLIQRKESLMGLLYLLTLYCAIRAGDSAHRRWWQAGAVLACAAGMATKQVMVTAPLAVLLYDRVFLAGSFRAALRRSWGFYLLLGGTLAVLVGSLERIGLEGLGVPAMKLGVLDYARSQFGVILHYLHLAFWPANLCLDYAWPVARGLGEYLPQAAAVGALLAAAAVLLWRAPVAGFPAAWFFLTLAPTSSIVVIPELAFEHRMYLPLAGVVTLAVAAGYRLVQHLLRDVPPERRARHEAWTAAKVLVLLVGAVLGYRTLLRNQQYQSPARIWADTVRQRPENARAHYNLGVCIVQQGQAEQAIAHFDRAIELDDRFAHAYNNRGLAWHALGRSDLAIGDFTRAIELLPRFAEAWYNRGLVRYTLRQYPQAIEDYSRAIELRPDYLDALTNRGAALLATGEPERALRDYDRVVEAHPGDAAARFNRAGAYQRLGDDQAALDDLTRAVELDPNLVPAYHSSTTAWDAMTRPGKTSACLCSCAPSRIPSWSRP